VTGECLTASGPLRALKVQGQVSRCRRVYRLQGESDSTVSRHNTDCQNKDYAKHLADALPDYADVYFDNVGGEILNTMFTLIKRYGFISACGAISGEFRPSRLAALRDGVVELFIDFQVTTTRDSTSPTGERSSSTESPSRVSVISTSGEYG